MNAHQRVTSVEENFNNQVGRTTHSVDTSWPLSQSTLSASNGLMNKVTMVIGMEVRQRAKQHELLLSKAALATTTAECPI